MTDANALAGSLAHRSAMTADDRRCTIVRWAQQGADDQQIGGHATCRPIHFLARQTFDNPRNIEPQPFE